MEKFKRFFSGFLILMALIMSMDDSFALYSQVAQSAHSEQTGTSDMLQHHHSVADHFFQHSGTVHGGPLVSADILSFCISHPVADNFHSKIWQPPQ